MPSGKKPVPSLPTRSDLERTGNECLTDGAPFKADVTVVDIGEGPMVVKDFAKRSWWRRLIGRLEIDRECRAYEYLGPMPCIPSFIGRIDRDALAVEKVEGISLRLVDDIDERRDTYLGQMRTAMERLTELGFLHLDARAYRNVLRRPDGRVVFIDLAGSFWIPPGHFGYRLLRRFTAIYYEANLIKWETMLAPGGDPRIGQARPPRYVHGIADFWLAWKRLRERRSTVQQ
jgi:hypothetical protein